MWELLFGGQGDADIFALGMLGGIAIVADEPGSHGEDGVVATHTGVLSRKPEGTSLPIDDHSSADLLTC